MKNSFKLSIFILFSIFTLNACEGDYTPKPRAYARIDLPTPTYIAPDTNSWNCPYNFEFSNHAFVTVDRKYENENCWYNLYYPKYRATIHLTYFELDKNLSQFIEENRKLAMKHIGKATQIEEVLIENPDKDVYGIVYDFKGETASDLQFFLTDSTTHMLRGSLYFNVYPNKDSLGPVIEYVKNDINHFIDSFEWSN